MSVQKESRESKEMLISNGNIPLTLQETQAFLKKSIDVSTPLIAVGTSDPAYTIKWAIEQSSKKVNRNYFAWDIVKGLYPCNENFQQAFNVFINIVAKNSGTNYEDDKMAFEDTQEKTNNLPEMLKMIAKFLPKYTILFINNAHLFFTYEPVIQGLWNLRDIFKRKACSVVLLGPSFNNNIPPELVNDIVCIEEELPDRKTIENIVTQQFTLLKKQNSNSKLVIPEGKDLRNITSYLTAMSNYAVEQRLALSLTAEGVNFRILSQQRKSAIGNIPGLNYEEWGYKFSDIGGLSCIKNFLSSYMNGILCPNVLVRMDEFEKALGGNGNENGGGDTSGVSQDALGVILSEMEDQGWTGIILVGVPGSGKSLISKALASEYQIPLISQDIGAARGSLVGQSERNIRLQMKTIRSMAGHRLGGALFIATCNKLNVLPPELKRRFKLGIWYFDLPTPEELESIWTINLNKFGLTEKPLEEQFLTGSDVANICYLSYSLNIPLAEARQYTTTTYISEAASIEKLRNTAHGKFLSSSYPGLYLEPGQHALEQQNSIVGSDMRQMNFE